MAWWRGGLVTWWCGGVVYCVITWSTDSKLKDKEIKKYLKHTFQWVSVAGQMLRARDSSHRVLKADEGRANEYFVAARS